MKISEKNQVVHYLLTQMTLLLLAKSPNKDAMSKASEKHEARLKALLTQEEFEPIGIMRDSVTELVRMLANCESVEALEQTRSYLQALNDGEVIIAVTDEKTGYITGYETNGRPNGVAVT